MQSPVTRKAAKALQRHIPEILRLWEAKVRAAIPDLCDESRTTLLSSIPQFLHELVYALNGDDSPGPQAPRIHAEQRASLPVYTLDRVIREYSLLRSTILQQISSLGPMELGDQAIILDAIDSEIAEASAHYVEVQAHALRESEERFRLLVASVKDYAIFMLDPSGHIISWNRGAESIKGYSAEEIVGKHFSVFYTEEDVLRGKPARGLEKARLEGRFKDEGVRVRKGGSIFQANVLITALRDDTGMLRGFAKVTRDVTQQKMLHDQLVERAELLERANKQKDEFLAMLAHELRNPLAAMANATYILQLHPDQQTTAKKAKDILERQGRHLKRLVDDLVDVSRFTQGKIYLQKTPVELKQLIEQVTETLYPFILERGQVLNVSVPEVSIWLEADFVRLSQVLSNVLHNSAKFTGPGGQIDVNTSIEDSEAVIRVGDTGQGIEATLLPRVFDLFTQGSHSHDGLGGMGMGLALARRLIEMHGGTITAHSEGPGLGSTFVMKMPVLRVEELKPVDVVNQSDECPLSSKKILIVDDNVDAASGLAQLLKLSNHSIRVANSGQEALREVKNEQPDVIILDIGLPDMDGYEVAHRLRAQPLYRGIKIIALTGYGQPEDRRKSQEAGFDIHLTKPTDFVTIERAISDERQT